jgi:hypothetical protein
LPLKLREFSTSELTIGVVEHVHLEVIGQQDLAGLGVDATIFQGGRQGAEGSGHGELLREVSGR